MKMNYVKIVFVLALGFIASSCRDNAVGTNTNTAPRVEMFAELNSPSVSIIKPDDKSMTILSNGDVVDSLRITRVRILVSRMILHQHVADSLSDDDDHDKVLKLGPFLITVDSAGQRLFATDTIPAGNYDKVKFEIHRFSSNEISLYLNDPLYTDFVSYDRHTVIIEGHGYKNGQVFDFDYRSNVTANLTIDFDGPFSMSAGTITTLMLQINPALTFKTSGQVLDPRDPRNHSAIEYAIRASIKAHKT
jgi:hypothetical protein